MSIGIGVQAANGISITADTELSWDDQGLKTEGGKLAIVEDGFAVAGSGSDIGYVEALIQEFQECFIQNKADGLDAIESNMAQTLDRFFHAYVLPHNDPSLVVTMLMGAQVDDACRMWVTTRNLLRAVTREPYISIGSGGPVALPTLRALTTDQYGKMYMPRDLRSAELINVYAISLVKASVQGCGNRTDIARISHNKTRWLNDRESFIQEFNIERFNELRNRTAQFVFGCAGNQANPAESAEHLKGFFLSLRDQLLQLWDAEISGSDWTI